MLKVKDNIWFCGIRDWELRRFHGHELSTFNGSSYNAYVIFDEKTVLVDTVWPPHKDAFMKMIEEEIGLEKLDYIVINHMEPDHGGSLGYIMEKRPDLKIICSVKGKDIIRKYFQKDWDFVTVKTGDRINIGKSDLVFVDMTMIHWPDSMMTFVTGSNVLLSNDAFGQHFCGQSLFEDECDECLVWSEALKYFAGILAPFTALIKRKVAEVVALNLPVEMIAPSHGAIWRKDPLRIVQKYAEWADGYRENYVVIAYDTMYNSTKKMGEEIARGLESEGVPAKLFNTSISDVSDLITEMFRCSAIVLGSCTVNNGYLRSLSGVVDEIKGHKLKKKGLAFGSYGWSGESPKLLQEHMKHAGLDMAHEPLSAKYNPDATELAACFAAGVELAKTVRGI